MKLALLERDGGCVGPLVGMPGRCEGPLDPDHVRASGALGRKSRTTMDNLVILCRYVHHRWKTDNGRMARPKLLDYIARRGAGHEAHVDPCGLDCVARVPPA